MGKYCIETNYEFTYCMYKIFILQLSCGLHCHPVFRLKLSFGSLSLAMEGKLFTAKGEKTCLVLLKIKTLSMITIVYSNLQYDRM